MNVTPNGHGLGFIPRLPDRRDKIYSASFETLQTIPSELSLAGNMPPVFNQDRSGICVTCGTTEAFQFAQKKQGLVVTPLSHLALYYWTRLSEGTQDYDSGCEIRDALKILGTIGDCPESEWPYDESKLNQAPPDTCTQDAKANMAIKFELVPIDLDQMKACIVDGFPIIVGLTLYESFDSQQVASDGIVPMPGSSENVIGGHCLIIDTFSDTTQTFSGPNSWGEDWGDHGRFHIPYTYAANPTYGSDYWKLELVT